MSTTWFITGTSRGFGRLIAEGRYNVMVSVQGDTCEPVPLEQVAGRIKTVPEGHPWIEAGRLVGTCFGD